MGECAEDPDRGVEEGDFICSGGLYGSGLDVFEALFCGVEELDGGDGEVNCIDVQVSEESVLT